MKSAYIKMFAAVLALGMTATSCDDFLDRPAEDTYNVNNYYKTDDQCIAGVDYLYNAPWYDFQRGYFCVGEGLSGNYIQGSESTDYVEFTLSGTNEQLTSMSASLWSVVAHSSQVYDNLKNASGPSTAMKNQCMGECLTWKALAYFFLVRSFGEVPIIHDGSTMLTDGSYTTCKKNTRDNVYEYITYTLEKAMDLMDSTSCEKGRLNYYSAEGLLAKTYLTRAGITGKLNAEYLKKAKDYAAGVIKYSPFKLEENYEDIFKLVNRYNDEGMIVWRWTANGSNWTRQNSLQADLGLGGMDDWGSCWGDWGGFTPDCQKAFGVDLKNNQPDSWINSTDTRLHATMMLPGFKYDQFWQDKGGFDYLKALYGYLEDGSTYKLTNEGVQSLTGSNTVKHIYGDTYDHQQGAGCSDARMASSVPSFILRLSDIYLIEAEAILLSENLESPLNGTTSNPDALNAFYTVRHRAIKNYPMPSSISFQDIWKERRLEFCMEGDRWYDYVRLSYYEYDYCKQELESQNREAIWNLGDVYKAYYQTGTWDATNVSYKADDVSQHVAISCDRLKKVDGQYGKPYLCIPPYQEDVVFNSNMALDADPVDEDVRTKYSYDK